VCANLSTDKLLYFAAIELDKDKPGATVTENTQPAHANWVVVGCGFGSLLYSTQAVFGDVSVLSRWVVSGYPDTGPAPHPWG